jgi:hypothetical protein
MVCSLNPIYMAVAGDHTRVRMPSAQSFLAIYNGFTSPSARRLGCTKSKVHSCPKGLFSL